jgi:SAM-dependent methyltransferase
MTRAKLREERVSRVCPAGAGRERLAARSQPVIARADKGERALRGTHDFVIGTIRREAVPGARVVDIGAGHGALSRKLLACGFRVEACELCPDLFDVPGIRCRATGSDGALPYEDGRFDLAVAVEVVEHVDSHRKLFSEAARILAPGGRFLFTTPNILSLKSRLQFLMSGFFYSFGPLDDAVDNPVEQHISPFTIDRYRFLLARGGLAVSRIETDQAQSSSRVLYWLAPLIRWNARRIWGQSSAVDVQNSRDALLGRKLLIVAEKAAT